MLLGHTPVCAVEIEPFPRESMLQRQRDGILPRFPIWDDVCTFDGNPWSGLVDIVCGGFPCQDLSIAGKGEGIEGSRSGLWGEMDRIIREVQPRIVFVENSQELVGRGLTRVLRDLAQNGYDAKWCCMGGHENSSVADGKRIWIYATKANGIGRQEVQGIPIKFPCPSTSPEREFSRAIGATWDEETDTRMRGNSDEMARGMERLKAIGNGQDPFLAATAFKLLAEN
jgi:DNA (cytosine-5)-methyltransferase 1